MAWRECGRCFVGDVMTRPVITLRAVEKVSAIVEVLRRTPHHGFPVVSMGASDMLAAPRDQPQAPASARPTEDARQAGPSRGAASRCGEAEADARWEPQRQRQDAGPPPAEYRYDAVAAQVGAPARLAWASAPEHARLA